MSRSEIRSGPYESSGFFLAPRDTFDSTVVKHTRIHAIDHDSMEIRIVATGDDGGSTGVSTDNNTHASSALTQRQQARVALGSEVLPRVGEHVRDALPLRVRQLAPRHRILQRRVEARLVPRPP